MKTYRRHTIFRLFALFLFLLSLLGPWTYDSIYVPAKYACDTPTVRLDGDFCGIPIYGFQFLSGAIGGFFPLLIQLARGTFTGRARELLVGLSLLLPLPLFSTLFLLWKDNSYRLQQVNRGAWALAGGLLLTIFAFQLTAQGLRLWGLWLSTGLAITVLIFELLMPGLNARKS